MIKALIVDDEKWSRNAIRSFADWEELGIGWVGEAEDGEEALRLVESTHPDIIMTDMDMPNVDGVVFLKRLMQEGIQAKIIVISGHDHFAYMQQAIHSHAVEYLLKPIDRIDLNRILRQCVQELRQDIKEDPTMFLKNWDKDKLDLVIRSKYEIGRLLQEQNIGQLAPVLSALAGSLQAANEDETLLTRLMHAYLGNLFVEHLMEAIRLDDSLSRMSMALRKQVEKGMAIGDYQTAYLVLAKAGVDFLKRQKEEENKSVVVRVKEYLDGHFMDNLSLEPLAKQFFVSKEYLSGAFRQKYNVTLSQYLLDLKMAEALRLIRQGVSHAHITERLGYQDSTYFYRVFKKYYGCAPGSYRFNHETHP